VVRAGGFQRRQTDVVAHGKKKFSQPSPAAGVPGHQCAAMCDVPPCWCRLETASPQSACSTRRPSVLPCPREPTDPDRSSNHRARPDETALRCVRLHPDRYVHESGGRRAGGPRRTGQL
jgi:hypothetical protein